MKTGTKDGSSIGPMACYQLRLEPAVIQEIDEDEQSQVCTLQGSREADVRNWIYGFFDLWVCVRGSGVGMRDA
jgi:hypothetical protein